MKYGPKLQDYEKLRHDLKIKLIMSELYKGKGILHFCCKKIWANHTRKMFWDNSGHFLVCHLELIESILEKYKSFYDSENLQRIARFNQSGSLPYLYIMAKEKDFNKLRPLASYFFHPLKLVYRYTSMALAVVLKSLPDTHFNLSKTFDTLDYLQHIMDTINEHMINPQDTSLAIYAGDIKNLFTELPHDEVEKAVFWALQTIQSKKHCRGRHSVTINLSNKEGFRIGPSYSDNNITNISLQQIYNVATIGILALSILLFLPLR